MLGAKGEEFLSQAVATVDTEALLDDAERAATDARARQARRTPCFFLLFFFFFFLSS